MSPIGTETRDDYLSLEKAGKTLDTYDIKRFTVVVLVIVQITFLVLDEYLDIVSFFLRQGNSLYDKHKINQIL